MIKIAPSILSADFVNLERDIKGRLNRYAADEEITAIWLWAEPLGEGIYQIFIGYA